ncbi:MAG: hypothetical protein ABIC91_04750 [Nanoarchaeota archaeon]|nr:hypothetical protein [Nanoarchaeota archaeon]MBU1030684.1 hypothetical protein [Nanoarchaeota archaeon]MBU1849343.1 hypothetical protein [Nanoarchaeota archaeon]
MTKKLPQVSKDYERIIKILEEELVRKDELIENIKKENTILLRTAIKQSKNKVDHKKASKL